MQNLYILLDILYKYFFISILSSLALTSLICKQTANLTSLLVIQIYKYLADKEPYILHM